MSVLTIESIGDVLNKADPEPLEHWHKYFIDLSINEPEPVSILTIGEVVFATPGNISAISGAAKAKKSFLCSAIAAAWINGECLGIYSFPPENQKKILYIDTEQSRPYVAKLARRITRLAGLAENVTPENLFVYSLKEIGRSERVAALKELTESINPGLIIVDGGRDLLMDFNNIEQANETLEIFQNIVATTNCHIITVLHENKGNNNMRGHFGAEVLNKAETVFGLVKEGETTRVTAAATRGLPFNDFSFQINDEGLPVLNEPEPKQHGAKLKLLQLADTYHIEALNRIFSKNTGYSYAELWKEIQSDFRDTHSDCSDHTAKNLLTKYSKDGLIIKDELLKYHYTRIIF